MVRDQYQSGARPPHSKETQNWYVVSAFVVFALLLELLGIYCHALKNFAKKFSPVATPLRTIPQLRKAYEAERPRRKDALANEGHNYLERV
jgi:hypothetical protein